jgi:hypothetical protein
VERYRKLFPHADERLFLKGGAEGAASQAGIVFDAAEEDEVDVDDI